MLAKVLSGAVLGIEGYIVEVEVDIAGGLPSFATVGLPEGAVKESKDRVKAAVRNSGYEFPARKITVNLAPADVKKEELVSVKLGFYPCCTHASNKTRCVPFFAIFNYSCLTPLFVIILLVRKDALQPPATIHHMVPCTSMLYVKRSAHSYPRSNKQIKVKRRLHPF